MHGPSRSRCIATTRYNTYHITPFHDPEHFDINKKTALFRGQHILWGEEVFHEVLVSPTAST
jgi:hypothetical protein